MSAVPAWYPLLLVVAGAAFPQGPSATESTATSVVPFYLEQTETMGSRKTTWVLARQSDGTTVRIEQGERSTVRDVFLRDATVSVFDRFKARVTWPRTSRLGVEPQPLPGCDVKHGDLPDDRSAGSEVVLGQVVAVTESRMGDTVITSWRAPGLDCEELYYRSELIRQNGSRQLVVEMRTNVLVGGDPDPALFAIDPNFVEVAPPVQILRMVETNGLPLPEAERDRLAAIARQAARQQRR